MKLIIKCKDKLFTPVDSSILGYFRIVFGIVMFVEFFTLEDYFVEHLATQKFFFTYDWFDWVRILKPDQLKILFKILQVTALLFILGVFYRINAIVIFLGWTYLFLTDRGHYNNHYYFYSIILLFFVLVDANRWAVFKNTQSQKSVPYWHLFIFRAQIFVVYFFGGIAKLDQDWLLGHPMANVIPWQLEKFPEIISKPLSSYEGAIVFSYAGLIFDLLIGFMLFSRKWRYWALLPIIVFHIMNHFLWTIGTFPWAMLFCSFLFFDPAWPRRFWEKISSKISMRVAIPVEQQTVNYKTKYVIVIFIIIHFSIQLFLPLRHWLYKGDVAWTGEGHLFAWRMMLTNSDDAIRMKVTIPKDNVSFYVDFYAYMHRQQLNKITKTPSSILKFVHFIKNEIKSSSGVDEMDIHLEIYKSINYRPARLLNDTTLNYANVHPQIITRSEWILPYERKSSELRVGIFDYENWDSVIY